ncbi:hypothetical protein [Rhizobium leguminosarum]|uniref:hypothetical protein n=1 Tax=Rhizobium leguminosarum TaxID=384 RepID=UPI001039B26B|nr:hypothetical protein [Rhizobium leguminosarum]TBZ75883.1 hypothetical protein E0H43_08505 [Rhizobium leguminosarum bv. viciae]
MLLKKLVEHFDNYTRLPIGVNTVRDQIIDLGIQDEIRFHLVDIDPSILRGLIYRYTKHPAPYATPIFCSEICLAKDQEYEWQRIIAVKELLHITDTEAETAQSERAIDKLIERLSLPFELREETKSSMNDRSHILPALAILVPKEIRAILRELRAQDKITDIDVARMAKIPDRYGGLVISDIFEGAVELICAQHDD